MISEEVFHMEVLGPHVPESLAIRIFSLFTQQSDESAKDAPDEQMTLDVRFGFELTSHWF